MRLYRDLLNKSEFMVWVYAGKTSLWVRWHWAPLYLNCSPENLSIKKVHTWYWRCKPCTTYF